MMVSFARTTLTTLLAILLLSVSSGVSATGIRHRAQAAKITAMKVSTLNPSENGIGTFDDIFANRQGNKPVFAGTGAANYPTHYLLVLVEVTGPAWSEKIQLTGTEGRRIVYNKISPSYVPTGEGGIESVKTYALFFIEGDRCETIKLTARLLGQRRASTMTRTIDFGCGE